MSPSSHPHPPNTPGPEPVAGASGGAPSAPRKGSRRGGREELVFAESEFQRRGALPMLALFVVVGAAAVGAGEFWGHARLSLFGFGCLPLALLAGCAWLFLGRGHVRVHRRGVAITRWGWYKRSWSWDEVRYLKIADSGRQRAGSGSAGRGARRGAAGAEGSGGAGRSVFLLDVDGRWHRLVAPRTSASLPEAEAEAALRGIIEYAEHVTGRALQRPDLG
ncbi:hypothetical protein ACN20G_10140 [Streptomyces sp. BI20]|uniref:hypothetical protein n=1 Tax=Streptomyces sp. BI20 TaxID=3403460 RepID=UPI003C71D68D